MATPSEHLIHQLRETDESLVTWQRRIGQSNPPLGACLVRYVELLHDLHCGVAETVEEFKEFAS